MEATAKRAITTRHRLKYYGRRKDPGVFAAAILVHILYVLLTLVIMGTVAFWTINYVAPDEISKRFKGPETKQSTAEVITCYCNLPMCVKKGFTCQTLRGCFSEVQSTKPLIEGETLFVNPHNGSYAAGCLDLTSVLMTCDEITESVSQINAEFPSIILPSRRLVDSYRCCSENNCNKDNYSLDRVATGETANQRLNSTATNSTVAANINGTAMNAENTKRHKFPYDWNNNAITFITTNYMFSSVIMFLTLYAILRLLLCMCVSYGFWGAFGKIPRVDKIPRSAKIPRAAKIRCAAKIACGAKTPRAAKVPCALKIACGAKTPLTKSGDCLSDIP